MGAIALVVFMVIALPIVLDREPKPVSQELTIQIPSQDAGRFASRVPPPEPPPAAPPDAAPAAPVTITPLAAPGEAVAAKSDKGDRSEAVPAAKSAASAPKGDKADKADKGDKPETARSELAAVKPKPEAVPAAAAKGEKPVAVASSAPRDAKPEAAKSEPVKVEEARTEPGKAESPKAEPTKADAGYVVPLGLFSKPDNIKQVRGKASAAGIKTFTEALAGSDRVRVRAGPFPTRDAAEKAREKLKAAGLDVGAVAAR